MMDAVGSKRRRVMFVGGVGYQVMCFEECVDVEKRSVVVYSEVG